MDMKKMKSIFLKSCLSCLLLAMAGCNSWLDINPNTVQTSDTYWQTKEECEQVLMGAYINLRDCLPSFFKWGELRADELEYGPTHNTANDQTTQDERLLKLMDIRPSNTLTDWKAVYSTIGRANHVITLSRKALENDITFYEELCNSYIAEAVFIRSLCYFYLVRTFRDVPYIDEPTVDDSRDFMQEAVKGEVILNGGLCVDRNGNEVKYSGESKTINGIINDLEEWVRRCKPGYEVEWQTKGRATCWAFYALMADIYLWQENYSKVREIYAILKGAGFGLEEHDKYWSIFYPGNNKKESIFELQFRGQYDGQGNQLFEWFQNGEGRYIISTDSKDLLERDQEDDIRGREYMYDNRYIGEKYWKYLGTQSRKGGIYPDSYLRPQNDREPNWIFYRFSDILLMEAEAMTMQGVPYNEVCEFLDTTIMRRAGYETPSSVPDNEEDMLEKILEERWKELLGEGKRWFDILRVARKQNYRYRKFLLEVLLKGVPAKDRAMWNLKLENEYGHYLPINKNEIEYNHGVLTQNPFYIGVE